jgi:alpha-L-fucosidase 2
MKHSRPLISRRRFLAGTAAMTAALRERGSWADVPRNKMFEEDAASPYTLHFAQPASKWPNALPVGNGRLGAMVFGVPGLDRLQLNEESIWDGEPNRDRNNPKAAAAIPQIRELLFAGRVDEAEALAVSDVLSIPRRMPCYQTLGDLHLDFSAMGIANDAVTGNYRLQLDLDTAIATTTFTHDGLRHRREVFCSAPDQVIVVRLVVDQPEKLHVRLNFDRPHNYHTARLANDRLTLTGQALPVNDNPGQTAKEHQTGVRFHAELLAISEGGKILPSTSPNDTMLEITGANALTLLIDCSTSYRYPAHTGQASGTDADMLIGDPAAMQAAINRNLTQAARLPYETLKARHLADHRRYFRRASFELGSDPNTGIPTDQRVRAIKNGGEDVHLLPIYFQFGRYMLISSSRPGTLAANLQGIWNESVDPPWGSKYTVNINTEMNYWLAEGANLSDCHFPLFDLLEATHGPGACTARELYGASGSVVHHNTDLWGDSGPIDGLGGGIWPMGSSWISLHLWQHYAYSGDRRFLAERVYPTLRENAVFLLSYLTRDPKTGHLTTGPSCSPENAYMLPDGSSHHLCMGPTMDISIVRAVFWRLLQSAALLKNNAAGYQAKDEELLKRVRSAMAELPPFQIGQDGRLQEWQVEYAEHESGHRHISHLFGLYPEDQITVQSTPELARAARQVLDKRLAAGGGSTGWSRSWIINCMARIGDGDACYANILELFRQSTRPNLFDVCGLKENSPFQIDGNLGAPSGLIEMLLQSHDQTPLTSVVTNGSTSDFVLRLLPALPKAWPNGSFRGLRARGGIEVDCIWNNGRIIETTIRANWTRKLTLVSAPGQKVSSVTCGGRSISVKGNGGQAEFSIEQGRAYQVKFA